MPPAVGSTKQHVYTHTSGYYVLSRKTPLDDECNHQAIRIRRKQLRMTKIAKPGVAGPGAARNATCPPCDVCPHACPSLMTTILPPKPWHAFGAA